MPALFYPEAEADVVEDRAFVPGGAVPLNFYLYKDGSDWKLVDITTPLKVKTNTANSLPDGQPDPYDLLKPLDSKLRFPKGRVIVQLPNGTFWEEQVSGHMRFSEWLTYIGLGLAAIALGLATAGLGTAATVVFFGASVAGAVAAGADIYEKHEQGLLTLTDVIVNVAQIVSEVAGITAGAAGKILRGTTAVELGVLADKVFVSAVKVKVAAQGVALIAMDVKVLDEMNEIDKAGGSDEDKKQAKARLASSALSTTAMVILSMAGDIADFRGRNIYVDKDFSGRVLARPLRQDPHLFEEATKKLGDSSNLEAVLARKDLGEELKTRIRGEVNYALDAGRIPKDRMQGILGKLKSAENADAVAQQLAELRHANRITFAGEVKAGSDVVVTIRAGEERTVAGKKVTIDPVSEADALYAGTDGRVHLDEVKNTTNALRSKLEKQPQQIERLATWRDAEPGREVEVAIESQEQWTDLFRPIPKYGAPLRAMIKNRVPLRIGQYKLTPAKMEELWAKTEAKAKALNMYPPLQDFFDNMRTLEDAEKFLGIKF